MWKAIGNGLLAAILAVWRVWRESIGDGGLASAGRLTCQAVIITWCWLVFKTHAVPDKTYEVAILATVLYAPGKALEMIQAWRLR